MHHHHHSGAPSQPDSAVTIDPRQLVSLSAEARRQTLSHMRDHLAALGAILAATAAGDYAHAAQIAEHRLGLDSPTGDQCRIEHAEAATATTKTAPAMSLPASSAPASDAMPQGMTLAGLAMHQAASAFAAKARQAAETGQSAPALAALAGVVERCNACHAAYRFQ